MTSPYDFGLETLAIVVEFWPARIAFVLAAEAKFPERVTRVRYENLLHRPKPALHGLCLRLELEPEPRPGARTDFRGSGTLSYRRSS